jgi:hypothetical protein
MNDIKVDIITHNYPMVKEFVQLDKLRIASVEDISAMKINAICGDGTRIKNFIDLYFLLKKYPLDRLLLFYKQNNIRDNILHAVKNINYFEDVVVEYWPKLILEKNLTWSTIKKTLIDIASNIIIKKLDRITVL